MRPSIEFKAWLEPAYPDMWIARFDEGFWASGKTPAEAMDNFDKKWGESQLPKEPKFARWLEIGMTKKEAEILEHLVHAGYKGIHRDRLMALLYTDYEKDWPQFKTLDVYMCKIRKKLERSKSTLIIETISAFGWRTFERGENNTLPPEFMQLLRKQRYVGASARNG